MANPVLRALDTASTQAYHFQAVLIAGMGFLTDAYDLFVIGILAKLLGRIYYFDPTVSPLVPGVLPVNVLCAVLGTALCGTLTGQLFFGWLGDKCGRKRAYGMTLALMVVASLGQGLSFGHTTKGVIATICFFRFLLGFGIGGDYPLSATIMSEYSNVSTRGSFVAAVFAMQGVGYLLAALVTIVTTFTFLHLYPLLPNFKDANPPGVTFDHSLAPHADWVWRIVLMFGALPAAGTIYARSKMPETSRYTALVQKDQQQAALDMERVLHTDFGTVDTPKAAPAQKQDIEFGLFTRKFLRRHGKELIGTCLSWFLLDVSFYSQNLLGPQVFTATKWVQPATSLNALQETLQIAKAQLIIVLCGTFPGYWFTVAFVDRIGRKPIQLMGFFFMTVFLLVLSFRFYDFTNKTRSETVAFVVFYSLVFFFCNFGPNATTFIVPAELFPARLRSTCHGISSAFGKAGAIAGTFGFLYASVDKKVLKGKLPKGYSNFGIGYKWSYFILAMCSVMGFIVTLICIPETKGRSLEHLSSEIADAHDNDVTNGDPAKEVDHDASPGQFEPQSQ